MDCAYLRAMRVSTPTLCLPVLASTVSSWQVWRWPSSLTGAASAAAARGRLSRW